MNMIKLLKLDSFLENYSCKNDLTSAAYLVRTK